MNKIVISALSAAAILCGCTRDCELHIVTTGDVHGSWFAQPYIEGKGTRSSLMSVKYYTDSLRRVCGKRNVLLLDAGDALQGDNAAYFFNYVDSLGSHLYPRIASYMGYDAAAMGNHDIETGHGVYDRVNRELEASGIAWLAGNCVDSRSGKPCYPVYKMFRRGGMKVMVLGFNNANISEWLAEELWSGMKFKGLIPCVQECVDEAVAKEHPDAVIVLVHSGSGDGNGKMLESQGLDLLHSLKGVDLLVSAHDHKPCVEEADGCVMINGGARASHAGHAVISIKDGHKSVSGEVVKMDRNRIDTLMQEHFAEDFRRVQEFTLRKVGELQMPLRTRDAYVGMCDYLNLIHTVQLGAPGAEISFAAPLTFDGTVKSGDVVFNDMFTIYPFENQLYLVRMSGKEIIDALEYSYDSWIQTPGSNVLKIKQSPDPRTGCDKWSFVNRSYNFDSAGGLNYTVDVTRPAGQRIRVISLADGRAFSPETFYNVAMTSYRANGGGGIIPRGAGIPKEELEGRIVARLPEIRNLIYDYFLANGSIDSALISETSFIGEWKFVPENLAAPLLARDISLVFPDIKRP